MHLHPYALALPAILEDVHVDYGLVGQVRGMLRRTEIVGEVRALVEVVELESVCQVTLREREREEIKR